VAQRAMGRGRRGSSPGEGGDNGGGSGRNIDDNFLSAEPGQQAKGNDEEPALPTN
jgi:hypothetical protein